MSEKTIKERAAEWAAQIPAEWTANVEARVAAEIAEWEAMQAEMAAEIAAGRLKPEYTEQEIDQLLQEIVDTVAAEQQRGNE